MAEQIVDYLVPQILERTVDAKGLSNERLQQRTGEPVVDVPVPQEQLVEVTQLSPQERIPDFIAEQGMDAPAPQNQVELTEVIQVTQLVPQERIAGRLAEKSFDSPGPLNQEQIVGVVQGIPQGALGTAHRGALHGRAAHCSQEHAPRAHLGAYTDR